MVPAEVLQDLESRPSEPLTVDHAGPWRDEWFPLRAEVRFDDGLDLAEAGALALCYAPQVRAARAAARVAGAQVLQAGVLSNPQLSLGPRISLRDSQWIFPASVTWELPLWGVAAAREDRAEALAQQRILEVVDAELDTLLEVRRGFLRLHRIAQERALIESLLDSQSDLLRWAEELQASGQLDEVSIYLARNERDEALLQRERLLQEARDTRRELLALTGLLPDAPVEFKPDPVGVPDLDAADRQALLELPGLLAAEAAYRTAEAALRLEVRKQYPSIAFGPTFEDDRGDPTLGPQLNLDLPFFDRNRGNIAAAEEARNRARDSYTQALLDAVHFEARARDALRSAMRRLEIHEGGALQNAEAASDSLQIRLRAGRASVLEVLAAQRAIAKARFRTHELREAITLARLDAALAGGLALRPTNDPNAPQEDQP